MYLRTKNEYTGQSIIEDDWGNFILDFYFDKALPFFKFSDIKLRGVDEVAYSLLHSGILYQAGLFDFFELNPLK